MPGLLAARRGVRAVVGHVALVGVAVSGSAIALGYLHHVGGPRGAPTPATPLPALVPALHHPAFVTLLWVLLCAYVVAVLCAPGIRLVPLLVVVVLLDVLFALTPPRPLTDLFSYVSYGRLLGVNGLDPYLYGPWMALGDPSFRYVAPDWRFTPTVYGPIFTALSAAVGHLGTIGAAWALKGLTAGAAVGSTVLVALATRRNGRPPTTAVAVLALNPLLLVNGVGGGHNDVLMILPLAAAGWLVAGGRDATGAAVATLAPAIKLSGGLVLPFLLVGERRWRVAAGMAGGALVLAAVTYAAFGTAPLHAMGLISAHTSAGHAHSLPAFAAERLGLAPPGAGTFTTLNLIVGGVLVLLLVATAMGRLEWTSATALATAAVVATAGEVFGWYGIWVLPVAALSASRWPRAAALALTALLVAMQATGHLVPLGRRL